MSEAQKRQIKSELQDHLESLNKHNSDIQKLKWQEEQDESWLTQELDMCESYIAKIRECNALLSENATRSSSTIDTARSLLKSPTAPLPELKSNEGEDLLNFFKDFEDITSMFKYSEYDKFILLKQQISGRALVLLNSLESDKQGYVHAKVLLTEALASKDNRILVAIKQISEMKMNQETDPFKYVSKMRNLTQSVNSLSLGSEDFLWYFSWHSMNESFKQHMTAITNSSRPTLKQITGNFFEASERYLEQKSSVRSKVKSSNGEKIPAVRMHQVMQEISVTTKIKISSHVSSVPPAVNQLSIQFISVTSFQMLGQK